MAMSSNSSTQDEKRDFHKDCLLPSCQLPIFRLKTSGVSIIRFVPEQDASGADLPAAIGEDGYGYLWSHLTVEDQVIFTGSIEKYSGFTKSSDRPTERDLDNPWASLYVWFKGQLNAEAKLKEGKSANLVLQPHILDMLKALTKREENRGAKMSNPTGNFLGQGYVLQLNGVPLRAPEFGIISAGGGIKDSLVSGLTTCVRTLKADPFAYNTGFTFKVMGKASGEGVARFYAELDAATPLSEQWRRPFTPWNKCLRLMTYDENVLQIVKCFGAFIVSQHPRLREDLVRLNVPIPAATAMVPVGGFAPPQPAMVPVGGFAPQQPVVQQTPAGFGPQPPVVQQMAVQQPATPPAGFQQPVAQPPVQQVPAGFGAPPAGFGAVPPAQPPVAAPAGFGAPAAPVSSVPPVAPVTPAVTGPVDAAKMEAEYKQMFGQQPTK